METKIEKKPDQEIQQSAKLAFLLSTCHKFADKTFIKLIKKYELDNIACMKYYYSIWVTLDKPPGNTASFVIKSVYSNFLNNTFISKFEYNILEKNNTLSESDKYLIKKNYSNILTDSNEYSPAFDDLCNKNIFTPINLINIYKDSYKYLFIPMILDYSQDIGLVHQCGLLVDLKEGVFIFYEPYGSYIKYELDYAYPVKQYLEIYKEVLPPNFIDENKNIKYYTMHQYFELPRGIQSILLEKNNSRSDVFGQKFSDILDNIGKDFPDLKNIIDDDLANDKNPVTLTDKTVKVLSVISCFNNFTPGENVIEKYELYFRQMLELYYLYNSKTCVSITIVEMNFLFSLIRLNKTEIKESIATYYKQYEASETPNEIIMTDINNIIIELFTSDLSHKINDNLNFNIMCGLI